MTDAAAAVAYLKRVFGGRSVMTFVGGRCLHSKDASSGEVQAFIERHADNDIYFPIADARDGTTGKPRKNDCLGSRYVWVDVDPPKVLSDSALQAWRAAKLAELEAFSSPRPHLIVDSGRGFWAYWRLSELTPPDDVEDINRALAAAMGGDSCHNIDRVARVPFTRNSKTGGVATVVRDEAGDIPADSLPRLRANTDAAGETILPTPTVGKPLTSLDELNEWDVPPQLRLIIEQGEDRENPKLGDNSRSAWLFHAVCGLLRCQVPDEIVMAILLDARWGISASVLATGERAEAYAARQLARARQRILETTNDFQRNERDKPVPSQGNIRIALSKLAVSVSHDQFADKLIIDGLEGFGPHLTDDAIRRVWLLIEQRFGFRPTKDYFWDVVIDLARQHGFHPVSDYLGGLIWDGEPRLSNWLANYGGAEDTAFTQAVAAILLIAAVRRIKQPGCKFDEMPTLEGSQGAGKSSALQILTPQPHWFADHLPLGGDGKLAVEQLAGRWIVEASELAGMHRGEIEEMKAFLSRGVDRARPAYARLLQEVPRQCVFVGTTNSQAYLRDSTGNRRFWPVKVEKFDLEALARDRDQLWAEAVHREALGESIRLDPCLWGDAAVEQEARRVIDPFIELLGSKLGDADGKILGADVWKLLGIPPERQPQHTQRMGDAMRALGWERKQARFGGSNPQWGYVRGTSSNRLELRPHLAGDWVLAGTPFKIAA